MFNTNKINALLKYLGLTYNEAWDAIQLATNSSPLATVRHFESLRNDFNALKKHLGVDIEYSKPVKDSDNVVRTVVKKAKTDAKR